MPNKQLECSFADWEGRGGFFVLLKAFFSVCAGILFKPVDFFRQLITVTDNVDLKRRFLRAIIFALIMGYLKLFFDTFNIYLLARISKGTIFSPAQLGISLIPATILNSPLFFFRPIIVFVVSVTLVTMGIKLILGFDKALSLAFLVVCYKSAADIFYCVPFFGAIFAATWSLVLIIIGIREVYSLNTLRSILASVIMPFLILLFFLLSAGTYINKAIFSFYPELKSQITKINDATAYTYTASIIQAAEAYKKDLGFYPANLGILKKYMPGSSADEVMNADNSSGYNYDYSRPDDGHFMIYAKPSKGDYSGKFVFYADQAGKVRLGGPDGAIIENIMDMESLLLQKAK